MTKRSHRHGFLKIGVVALEILGFAAVSAIAQTPPDVVIESEPEAGAGTVVIDGEQRFVCQYNQGEYTVMYQPESQPGETYAWAVPEDMGGGWTAERRCNEISRRLEMYRADGLVELTTGRENNYDIVCVTTEANNSCQIVFTVPQGQNAIATRDAVFENLATAEDGVATQGVNTFGSRQNNNNILGQIFGIFGGNSSPVTTSSSGFSRGINLKPFLDPSDGGTGSALTRGNNAMPTSPSRQLNPDLFR